MFSVGNVRDVILIIRGFSPKGLSFVAMVAPVELNNLIKPEKVDLQTSKVTIKHRKHLRRQTNKQYG